MLKKIVISSLLAITPVAALANPPPCAANWPAAAPGDLLATHVEDLGGDDTFNALKSKKGKIFVVGTTNASGFDDMVVAKYRHDGACGLELDPGFNGGLPIVFDFDLDPNAPFNHNSGTWIDLRRIDTDDDGIKDDHEIYAGGTTEMGQGILVKAGVAKFLSDGSPDLSYGGGPLGGGLPVPGSSILACSVDYDSVADGFVTSEGEAIFAGQSANGPGGLGGRNYDFYSAKMDPTGSPAPWANGGCAVEQYGGLLNGWDATEFAVSTMDFDGKVLSVGAASIVNSGNDIQLIRYLSDGAYDPSFGNGGVKTTSALTLGPPAYYLTAEDAALAKLFNLRRIVVVGRGIDWGAGVIPVESAIDMFIIRYLEDGDIDMAFGTNGFIRSDLGLTSIEPKAVTIDRWKRTIVAGEYGNPGPQGDNGIFVARFDMFGNLDATFGVNGVVTTNGRENVAEIGIAHDGKSIFVVGGSPVGSLDAMIYLFKG